MVSKPWSQKFLGLNLTPCLFPHSFIESKCEKRPHVKWDVEAINWSLSHLSINFKLTINSLNFWVKWYFNHINRKPISNQNKRRGREGGREGERRDLSTLLRVKISIFIFFLLFLVKKEGGRIYVTSILDRDWLIRSKNQKKKNVFLHVFSLRSHLCLHELIIFILFIF